MAASIVNLQKQRADLLRAIKDTEAAIDNAENEAQVKSLNRRLAGLEQRIDDICQQLADKEGETTE